VEEDGGECRVCKETECDCLMKVDADEQEKIIRIMSEDDFINFINQIGSL